MVGEMGEVEMEGGAEVEDILILLCGGREGW